MLKRPQTIFKTFFISFLSIYGLFIASYPVYSDEISDLENQIEETENEIEEKEGLLSDIEDKIADISNSNYSVSQKISLINEEIEAVQEIIDEKDEEIETKLKEIELKQEDLENKKVSLDSISSELYMESRYGVGHFFLTNSYWDNFVKNLFVKKNMISFLLDEIEKVNSEFTNLADTKEELEEEKKALDEEKEELDESYDLLADEKAKLQAQLSSSYATKSSLNSDIEDLNAKVSQLQQALINARSSGYISTGGSTSTSEGTAIAQAPSGYFGVFSIGAYTHRNGMSQWGAQARAAQGGQSYVTILNTYYPNTSLKSSTMSSIRVMYCDSGSRCRKPGEGVEGGCINPQYVTYDFETEYLYRLGEMPESFHIEALKAQAVAARTYALRVTNYGSDPIRADTCHQYIGGLKTGKWKDAVDATDGKVLKTGSSLSVTMYAAVHGASFLDPNVSAGTYLWDTVNGNGSDWFADAWEKKSGVNWFYKSWFRKDTYTSGYNCGHSPWMSPDEMVGVVNSYLIKYGIGTKNNPDLSRLLPQDYGECSTRTIDYGRTDKTPYTFSQLKSFLISPVQTIYSVNASFSNGQTSSITFNTNRGPVTMSGMNFKNIYNQVAPGHMRIQQQSFYAFFNIEKK